MYDAQAFGDWLEENDHNNSQGVPLLYPDEVYTSFYEIHGNYADDYDEIISDVEEAYYGEFDSIAEFAESMANDLGTIRESYEWPYSHIDWEAAGEALMEDYNEYNRYYFRTSW